MERPVIHYDFYSPPHISFGWGRRAEAGRLARGLGRRAFVVHGSRTLEARGVLAELFASLNDAGVEAISAAAACREPEIEDVDRTVSFLRERGAGEGDLVLAIGGGSAIDLAKAAAALATNPAPAAGRGGAGEAPTVVDYLEGVGKGLRIDNPPLPLLAMPTTSGTGSEATKNAVISSRGRAFKKSLRSDLMVPRVALLDPELSVSVPAETTAYTGMDAITQLIESYISRRTKPIPQALALHGLEVAAPAIVEAVENGASRPAREAMAHAALLSGMALANSGLGMAHGVAAALGACCGTPHGLACAVMLPVAMRVNRRERRAELARLGSVLTGKTEWPSQDAAADAAVEKVEELCAAVSIPTRLSEIGVAPEKIPELARASRGSSMSGNPRELSDDELRRLLENMQ